MYNLRSEKMATVAELVPQEVRNQKSRRSTLEIMCDVLDVVSAGKERPTHIIYRANISWKVLNTCLSALMANGLLNMANDGKRDTYRVTDKGYGVLALYRDLRERLGSERPSVSDYFQRGF